MRSWHRRGSLWVPADARSRYIGRRSTPRLGGGGLLAPIVGGGGGGAGDPNEPIFRQGVDINYAFEDWQSYATPTDLFNFPAPDTDGIAPFWYDHTEVPTFSTSSPAGPGGKKILWPRSANTGGHLEIANENASTAYGWDAIPDNVGVLIATWHYRDVGPDQYWGKGFLPQQTSGNYRFVCSTASMNYGYTQARSHILRDTYWNTDGTGKFADTPFINKLSWHIWHDGIPSPPTDLNPDGFTMYAHNINSSLFDYNTAFCGSLMSRVTMRITASTGGYTNGQGKGRVEMWQAGVKTHEWIGDNAARPEFGQVYTPTPSIGPPFSLLKFPGPGQPFMSGNSTVEYGQYRIWSPA